MKGTCLCGAIEVTAPKHNEVSLCHCDMCRKWSSGPLHAVHCGPGVTFSGAEPKRYQSSNGQYEVFVLNAARTSITTYWQRMNTFFQLGCLMSQISN